MSNKIIVDLDNVDRERFFNDPEYRAEVERQTKELNDEYNALYPDGLTEEEKAEAEAQFEALQKESEEVFSPEADLRKKD